MESWVVSDLKLQLYYSEHAFKIALCNFKRLCSIYSYYKIYMHPSVLSSTVYRVKLWKKLKYLSADELIKKM